jgi:spore maturation protein CgeB
MNPANRTWFYRFGLKFYDVVFTTKSYNADPSELPSLGARRVVMVDKAYDPDEHRPVALSEAETEWLSCDVGFIGSYEKDRAEQMLAVARHGIPVRIWGNGWENFRPDEKNLTVERRALVNDEDNPLYTKGICATRINLAFLRKANRDLHTDRSIEIPACGGFMLAEYSDEHARLFEEGKEAAFFRNRGELMQKIRHYLDNEDERSAIAAAGRQRCLEGGYSHQDRVAHMLDAIFAPCG